VKNWISPIFHRHRWEHGWANLDRGLSVRWVRWCPGCGRVDQFAGGCASYLQKSKHWHFYAIRKGDFWSQTRPHPPSCGAKDIE